MSAHRRLPLVAPALALLVAVVGASPAVAQDESPDGTTSTSALVRTDPDSPAGNILPRPDTGTSPDSPNDPGGWQQYLVFGLIVLGLGMIAAIVTRESRRARLRSDRAG